MLPDYKYKCFLQKNVIVFLLSFFVLKTLPGVEKSESAGYILR